MQESENNNVQVDDVERFFAAVREDGSKEGIASLSPELISQISECCFMRMSLKAWLKFNEAQVQAMPVSLFDDEFSRGDVMFRAFTAVRAKWFRKEQVQAFGYHLLNKHNNYQLDYFLRYRAVDLTEQQVKLIFNVSKNNSVLDAARQQISAKNRNESTCQQLLSNKCYRCIAKNEYKKLFLKPLIISCFVPPIIGLLGFVVYYLCNKEKLDFVIKCKKHIDDFEEKSPSVPETSSDVPVGGRASVLRNISQSNLGPAPAISVEREEIEKN